MKKTGIFLAVMMLLTVVCVAGITWSGKKAGNLSEDFTQEFAVLLDSGFYQTKATVRITAPKGASVYYTMNCEEPTSENGKLYEGPVVLKAPESGEQVYVLRFKAYYADGTCSETENRTYFVGQDIESRYTTMVLSIVGEPEELFGYEEGILVPGKRYDEFMEANPGIHPGNGVVANYTMKGDAFERAVWLEMFSAEGEKIFAQNGGVRVTGQLSRMNNHKSLRLYARKEYDEVNNKFDYDFFENITAKSDGTMGQEYKRLVLKNSGNDYGYAFLRTELVGCLADQAGFPDVQHVIPICVYVNGEYYGSYWLSNHFDGQYFENRYGIYDGEFVVLESTDIEKLPSEDSSELEISAAEDYNMQYNKFSSMDLTVDANYEALQEFMDVENYLQYFAIENYVGNYDWPDNNVKVYRYVAGESGYQADSVFDGRYRMLLYDVDYGFGLMFYHDSFGTLANKMTLDKILNEKSPMFAALMQREDCRKYFVSYTLDLMNGVMSAENVSQQVDKMHGSRAEELSRTLEQEELVGGLLLEQDAMNMDTVDKNLQQIKSFATARPQYVLQDIEQEFSYGQKYQLIAMTDKSAGKVAGFKINQIYCDDSEFVGTYLKEIPVIITPCVGPNEVFSYWLVDGERVENAELVLEGELVAGDLVTVELVTEEIAEPKLQICAVATRGQADYIELVNLSSQYINTAGYYLSDEEDLFKCELPTLVMAPGEKICLVGKDNNSIDSLGQYGLNFNLKTGETLQLTYRNSLIDSVTLPKLSEDGVYVRDFVRGTYVEQKREQMTQ